MATASYDSQMLDHLHATAFQTGPAGDALKHPLEGSADSLANVTAADVAGAAAGVRGSDVVVVGTGGGTHEDLAARAHAAYGDLEGGGSGKEVGAAAAESAFLGSDVRCVRACVCVCCCDGVGETMRVVRGVLYVLM